MNQDLMITVQTTVHAPLDRVWRCWTEPTHVTQWNHASDDWHSPSATNDVRVGGAFHFIMAAKDGSAEFDFNGTYTEVTPEHSLAYTMEGGRKVTVTFEALQEGVRVTETFEMEMENTKELQMRGWQAILDTFARHAETCGA